MKKLKISIDLDGIVVDFHSSLRKELIKAIGYDCNFYSKPSPVSYYINEWPEIKAISNGPEEVIRLSSLPLVYQKAKPVKDAIKSLNMLRDLGHELWFITARPKNLTQTTQDWLKKYGLSWGIESLIICDALFTDHAKAKSIACQKIKADILIDDHAETIRNIVCPTIKLKILLSYPWNIGKDVGPNAIFCKNWEEILQRIEKSNITKQ